MSSYHDVAALPVGTEIAGTRILAVTHQGNYGTTLEDVKTGEAFCAYMDSDPGSWVFSVTKPAPKQFKVGDIVRDDDYAHLPVGAVVRSNNDVAIKTAGNSWAFSNSNPFVPDDEIYFSRVIVHLPS